MFFKYIDPSNKRPVQFDLDLSKSGKLVKIKVGTGEWGDYGLQAGLVRLSDLRKALLTEKTGEISITSQKCLRTYEDGIGFWPSHYGRAKILIPLTTEFKEWLSLQLEQLRPNRQPTFGRQ